MRHPLPGAAALALLAFAAASPAQSDHPDTCAEAAPIAVGAPPLRGIIDPPTDEDWFAFDAAAGRLYRVVLESASAGFIPYLTVVGPDCETTVIDLEFGSAFLSTPGGGTHHIRVSSSFRGAAGGLGSDAGAYSLGILDLGPNPDDVGDTPASAAPLVADSAPLLGRIDYFSDVDFFRITLQERTLYEIHATDTACAGVFTTVLDRDAASYLASGFSYSTDAFGSGGCTELYEERARVYIPAGAGGEYFVRVSGSFNPATEYALTAATLASFPAGDDHGDTCAGATPLAPGSPAVMGALDPASDVDAFVLTAQAGHFYRIQLDRTAALTVLGPDCGGPIPMPLWASPSFVAPADGAYHILVTSRADAAAVYTLSVTEGGPVADDYANTADDAAPIPADGAPTTGVIDYHGDIDVFRLSLQPHASYRVELRTPGCAFVSGQVFAAAGAYLGDLRLQSGGPCSDPRTYARTLYIPLGAGGDHLLEVSGTPGPYTITVTPEALFGPGDAHPDDCADAAPLAIGAPPLAATIDPPGDVDWFVFDAAAGHVYTVTVPDRIDYWPMLEVRGPGCSEQDALVIPGYTGPRTFRALTSGPHSAGVRFFEFAGGPRPGPYTIAVADLGPADDDHPEGPTDAPRLRTDGTPATGRTDFAHDLDVFRVWLRPQTSYQIDLRSDHCTRVRATLHGFVPRTYRAELHSIPAKGCEPPPYSDLPYYAPSTEHGDYLIAVTSHTVGAAYTLSVTPTGCLADFDHSGAVNSADVSAFLAAWLAAVSLPYPDNLAADFNGDTLTNSADISAFLTTWLGAVHAGGC